MWFQTHRGSCLGLSTAVHGMTADHMMQQGFAPHSPLKDNNHFFISSATCNGLQVAWRKHILTHLSQEVQQTVDQVQLGDHDACMKFS